MRLCPAALLLLCACSSRHTPKGSATLPVFTGACDASGAVALSDRAFAVADDEDNVIRIYDAERGGAPLHTVDLSASLGLSGQGAGKRRAKSAPETDLEAATRIGELAFWITSHARSASGELRPERSHLF